MIESRNFEILRERWEHLADLGGLAERYVFEDPSGSLVKQRAFIEQMCIWIYDTLKFDRTDLSNIFDILEDMKNKNFVNAAVLNKFHFIRKLGNSAAHANKGSQEEALEALQESVELAQWFAMTVDGEKKREVVPFVIPSRNEDSISVLAKKETQLNELMEKLQEERRELRSAQLELEELKKAGVNAASALEFSEEQTRERLIDIQLAAAGWTERTGLKREVKISDQPTESRKGFADYVLYGDNGLPLAVIEAKRTSREPSDGKAQAKYYADGLESQHGQRPIIFYTNGYEIFIYDDAQSDVPRKLYGFYSKDSLHYLVQQRSVKKDLKEIELREDIAGRQYQLRAIRSAFEDFTNKRRKALFVLATGTGKTRVSVSLCDALIRARWAKRILFLCDRKELRKQAKNAFAEFIHEPAIYVKSSTYKQRENRLYFATYPAMKKVYQTFDVGFFDLIIADESHRSIYNTYGDLFKYFDCLQLGLTATPRKNISHNTYKMFDRQPLDPTSYYSYEEGVEEKHLVPFEVYTHTTNFQRDGIQARKLTAEQIKALEDDGYEPEEIEVEKQHIDKQVYNKDTNRKLLRNLMENGIRDAADQNIGKSIIFARNHKHAVLLADLFCEMYPQYGGEFCQVIDNYVDRAEQLIDDFKDPEHPLTIAVSVDMMDTGIDVPEVVNLSFAKPVKSYVKFWQMIGRGTRLCQDLFGIGRDKQLFRIFDHWDNFTYFEEEYRESEAGMNKSLMQRLFEDRIELAELARNKGQEAAFLTVSDLLRKDIIDLPESTIAVRDKWRTKCSCEQKSVLDAFYPETVKLLQDDIAPLMQWVDLRGRVDARAFDALMTQLEIAFLNGGSSYEDYYLKVQGEVALLPMHLNPVRKKTDIINQVGEIDFWKNAVFEDLEMVREELRGIMQYKQRGERPVVDIPVIDIPDGDEQFARRKTTLTSVDMEAYKRRAYSALEPLFAENPTLKKIRNSEPITENEFAALASLVLTQHPTVDLQELREFYPAATMPLEILLRSIVGLEIKAVEKMFETFLATKGGHLEGRQAHFMQLLYKVISKSGTIKVEQLYEAPFTSIHVEGPDGIFETDEQIDALIDIVKTFDPELHGATERV